MANAESTRQAFYVIQDITAGAVILLSIIIILTIMVHKELRRRKQNHLLVSLAVSDLLSGFAYCAVHGMNLREESSYLLLSIFVARNCNAAAVIFDFYISIRKPFKYRTIMTRFCRFIIAACWVVAVVIILPPLLLRNDPNPGLKRKISITFLLLLGIVTPYSFICVAFISIFRRIKKRNRLLLCLNKFRGTPMRLRHLKNIKKKVRLYVVNFLILSLSGLPLIYIIIVATLVVNPMLIPPFIVSLSNLLVVTGSLVNIFLYGFKNSDLRDRMKRRLRDFHTERGLFPFRSSRVSPSSQMHQLRSR